MGESGCGKSTIGRQIVGLERPTEGIIRYDGKDLSAHEAGASCSQIRTQLQMVFQDPYSSLNPRKHIYEILAQPMLYHHIATKATVGKELERHSGHGGPFPERAGQVPHEFSGGQRQRIGIARALSLNPRFLVCDEPVSALDVSIQAQILNLLKSLQKELNLTCIFVGHGLGAVNYVSDRIAVMYLGKIVEIGKAADVFRSPAHPYTKALIAAAPVPDPEKARSRRESFWRERWVPARNRPPDADSIPDVPSRRKAAGRQEPQMREVKAGSGHFAACPVAERKGGTERMGKYIVKRILIAIPVLIGITIIDYAIMCMAGSPLEMLQGPESFSGGGGSEGDPAGSGQAGLCAVFCLAGPAACMGTWAIPSTAISRWRT